MQATQGTAERKGQIALRVQLVHGHLRLNAHRHLAVVTLIDQSNKTPHAVVIFGQLRQFTIARLNFYRPIFRTPRDFTFTLFGTQAWHLAEQDDAVSVTHLHKFSGGQGLLAQFVKRTPQHGVAGSQGFQYPMPHCNRLLRHHLPLSQTLKQRPHHARLPRCRQPITLLGDPRMQSVILSTVYRHHGHMFDNRGDRRRKPVAIETLAIQLLRWLIGGAHQHHTLLKHHLKQAAQDDRVTNVIDKQLVKTQHSHLLGQTLRQCLERVLSANELKQTLMHPLHEMVKVLAPRWHRHTLVELIHQPGFTPAHRPP